MFAKTLEINWHDGQALYSIDFSPDGSRFATAGADGSVRLWSMKRRPERANDKKDAGMLPLRIDFLSELRRHTSAVNVVRFSPKGDYLASAGDDTSVILWKLSDHKDTLFGSEHSEYEQETWSAFRLLYGHNKEIYDLAWSPCGQYFITASIDNTARVWSLAEQKSIHVFTDHKHYVQGVTWDPLGQYVMTQSSDRSTAVYKCLKVNGRLQFGPCSRQHSRLHNHKSAASDSSGSSRLYHDENLVSFFRRLSFSPDGALVVTPAGLHKSTSVEPAVEDAQEYCSFIYPRNTILKHPIAYTGHYAKPSTVARWCPQFYERRGACKRSLFSLPYRLLYAVATQDTVYIYDTQQARPLCSMSGMHFAPITDLAWSPDGTILTFASADGYCSAVVFDDVELGTLHKRAPTSHIEERDIEMMDVGSAAEAPTPTPTPTSAPAQPDTVATALPETTVTAAMATLQQPSKRRITPQLISAPTPVTPMQDKAKKRRITPTLVNPK